MMTKLHLDIDGMTCGHCVQAVRRALEGMDGVEIGDVRIGSADVAVDERHVPREKVLDTIADVGYQATVGSAV
jgi:copper chaperone